MLTIYTPLSSAATAVKADTVDQTIKRAIPTTEKVFNAFALAELIWMPPP
jgi:hypothetical protein